MKSTYLPPNLKPDRAKSPIKKPVWQHLEKKRPKNRGRKSNSVETPNFDGISGRNWKKKPTKSVPVLEDSGSNLPTYLGFTIYDLNKQPDNTNTPQ